MNVHRGPDLRARACADLDFARSPQRAGDCSGSRANLPVLGRHIS